MCILRHLNKRHENPKYLQICKAILRRVKIKVTFTIAFRKSLTSWSDSRVFKTIGAKSRNIKELAVHSIIYFHTMAWRETRREMHERREDRIKSSRPIPSMVWCGGVAHVDRKRRLPRIAEIHVEAGGQSDLVGKRSRCDSTPWRTSEP